MELITTIEKCLGLPCNWKSYPYLRDKYSWIDILESLDLEGNTIFDLESELEELKENIKDLEYEINKLENILDGNNIEY